MTTLAEERGETLIEVLVTIIVLSIGLVAVVGAMGTSIVASSSHRSMASAEVVGREYGELLKAEAREASAAVHPCPTWMEPDLTPAFTRPGWTPTIEKVEYWIPAATPPQGGFTEDRTQCTAHFDALCPSPAPAAPNCATGLQRVTFAIENDLAGTAHARFENTVLLRRGNA